MIRLALACGSAALLSIAPITAVSADGPSPETLRATLADPTDGPWTEADVGAASTLEGPITIASLTSYYETFGQSASWIQFTTRILQENGFVVGYGRDWFRPGTSDELFEEVLVFGSAKEATAVFGGYKVRYAQTEGFKAFFDAGVDQPSFGMSSSRGGFTLLTAGFVRGNALYGVSRDSSGDANLEALLTQTRTLWSKAPSGFAVAPQTVNRGTSLSTWVFLIAGSWILVALGAVIAITVIAISTQRHRRPAMPLEAKP